MKKGEIKRIISSYISDIKHMSTDGFNPENALSLLELYEISKNFNDYLKGLLQDRIFEIGEKIDDNLILMKKN